MKAHNIGISRNASAVNCLIVICSVFAGINNLTANKFLTLNKPFAYVINL